MFEYKEEVWLSPEGNLFVVYDTLSFSKAAFNEVDTYHPICCRDLIENVGCEYLGEL